MTPGIKTTEFWLTLAAVLLSAMLTANILPSGGLWEKIVSLALAVLATLGYQASRAIVKSKGK